MGEGVNMVSVHSGITLIFLTFAHLEAVHANCSGGVTSQTVSYGDSGMSELMLPSVIRNTTCTWEVTSNTNGLRLELKNFTIPQSDLCEQGYLEITVGEYGKYDSISLDKWCGEFYPRTLQLSGHVFIRLHLQRTQSRVGFKLKYTSILPSEFCPSRTQNLTGSGYIYAPGYGGHWTLAPSVACRWQIEADPGHVLQVELSHVDFSQWACSRQQAKLTAYDGNAFLDELGSWCTTNVLTVIKSNRPGLHLSYINKVPHRGTGFVLKYYQVPDYHSDCAPYVRDVIARRTPSFIQIYQSSVAGQKICRWNITSENDTEVVVMETEYYNLGTIGCPYVELSYYDGQGASQNNLQRHVCSGIKLISQNVIQSSGRHAYIEMKYNSISQSVDPVRALIKIYSVPKVPCWNEHRTYIADESVSRLWIPIDNTTQHSGCDIKIQSTAPDSCIKVETIAKTGDSMFIYNHFIIYNGLATAANMYEPRCSTSGKPYTYSTGPSLLLFRRLSALNDLVTLPAIDGFWLEYSSGKSCDIGDYTEVHADGQEYNSFTIPPSIADSQNTSTNHLCRYIIMSPSLSVLQLYLSDSGATSQSDCNNSAAVISDGIEGKGVIGWWCRGRGEDYVSADSRVYISYMHKGITSHQHPPVIVYYRSKPKVNCHQSLLAPEGSALTISSPYYPMNYPNNASCSWQIRASRFNYRVEMHVKKIHIDMGHNATCEGDYLAFHDGGSSSSREMKRYCGEEADTRPARSSGQRMYVEFQSDQQTTARGFQATYKSVKLYKCNETLQAPDKYGPQQFLSSPNFPNNYYSNMACYWLLETTENHVIQIEVDFAEFTGSHSTCSGDSLSFHDGKDEASSLIGRVCGIELPTYRSTGRQMYIVFQANNDLVTGRGFQLQYFSTFLYRACQAGAIERLHVNTSMPGILTSPFYPKGFPAGLACQWRISASSGKQIELKVEQSDIVANCDIFQVTFYNGPALKGSTLGTWCGERDRYFTSTDNNLFISFHSSTKTRTGFKLSYRSLGSIISRSSTALRVGIVIASVVFVIVLVSVIACCCCCHSDRRKRGRSESQTETETVSNSSADKKNTSEPLIGHPKYVKESKLPDGSLVPSAPPMEDDTGIVNAGFSFGESQSKIPTTQMLNPALPVSHNHQKTFPVVDHLLQQRGQNPKHLGEKTGRPLQPIQEVLMPEENVRISRQYHLGNSCNHANMIHRQDVGHRAYVDRKQEFEDKWIESKKQNHQQLKSTEHVYEDGQIRQEPGFAETHNRPSPKHDQMKFVEIIEYGGQKGGSRGEKNGKRKKIKNKKNRHTDINEKTDEPMKHSLTKLSSIECSEEDVYEDTYKHHVSLALQDRHHVQPQYPPDPRFHHPEEPLSDLPFALSQIAYASPEYLDPSLRDNAGTLYQDEAYQPTACLPCHQHHFLGSDSVTGDDENNRVIHAEVHSASPNITGLYPELSLVAPRPTEAFNGANAIVDNGTDPNTETDVRMYPVLHSESGSTNAGMIWSTGQPMEMPHFNPLLNDVDDVPKKQSIWHKPPVTSNIPHVPMLVPIHELKSATSQNQDIEICYIDLYHADNDNVFNQDNCDGAAESKEYIDDDTQEILSANQLPVSEELSQADVSFHGICMTPSESKDVVVRGDCSEESVSTNELNVPPDPAKLTNILPPLHWICDSQQSGCADSLAIMNTSTVPGNISLNEVAFYEEVLYSNHDILPADDPEFKKILNANIDDLDVATTTATTFPEDPSQLDTKTSDQTCHDHMQSASKILDLSQHKEDQSSSVSELDGNCQNDEEPTHVFQLHTAPKSTGLKVEENDLDSEDDEHQKKLDVLLQGGFTAEDVEQMDESVV